MVSFRDNKFLCAMNVDVSLVKIKTEANSNDCSHDKPSTGMFAVSDDIFSAVSCRCILCDGYCLRCFDCCGLLAITWGAQLDVVQLQLQ